MKLNRVSSPTKTTTTANPSSPRSNGQPRVDTADCPPPMFFGDNARITVCATQGGRKYMEDRLHVHVEHGVEDGVRHAFYAVYDGHGGGQAAEFSRNHLYENLRMHKHFNSSNDDDVEAAMSDAFLKTHRDMLDVVDTWPRTASGFQSTAGTTASVALIRRGKMYTGHVGDSAIVAGHATKRACLRHGLGEHVAGGAHCIVGTMITTEHKPDAEDEQRRIVEHGGSIACKSGVMRVVWNRTRKGYASQSMARRGPRPMESIPFLAVARSLGDLWSYNAESDEYIVSPKPDTDVVVLDDTFKCIVLASDGLWNVMRAQNAVDIVNSREWRRFPTSSGVMGSCQEERAPHERPVHENHARALIRHGLRLWSHMRADNISVLVVVFDPPSTSIDPSHSCVHEHDVDMRYVDRILVDQPDVMLRISDDQTQLLHTAPVDLVYNGAIDNTAGGPPIRVTPTVIAQMREKLVDVFSGPGFSHFTTSAPGQTLDNTQTARHRELNPVHLVEHATSSSGHHKALTAQSSSAGMPSVGSSPCSVTKTSASFYCNKHGLTCERVLLANRVGAMPSPASIASRTSKRHSYAGAHPSPPSKRPVVGHSHATEDVRRVGGDNKYYCRKHGLQCEKVRQMNMHWSLDTSVCEEVGSDDEEDVNTPVTRTRAQSSAAASSPARATPLGKRTYEQSTRVDTPTSGKNEGDDGGRYRLRASTTTAAIVGCARTATRNKAIRKSAQKLPLKRLMMSSLLSVRTAGGYGRPALHRAEGSPATAVTSPMTRTANLIDGMTLGARRRLPATRGTLMVGRSLSADDSPPAKGTPTRRDSVSGSAPNESVSEPTTKRPRLFTWMAELFNKKDNHSK